MRGLWAGTKVHLSRLPIRARLEANDFMIALPFSHWVSTVSPRTDVPYIAVWTVLCFCLPGLLLVAASDDFVETLILAGAAVTNITAYA